VKFVVAWLGCAFMGVGDVGNALELWASVLARWVFCIASGEGVTGFEGGRGIDVARTSSSASAGVYLIANVDGLEGNALSGTFVLIGEAV
jgi:hypothetical protein